MWLYVPTASTLSLSAQAEPGSISESSWQCQTLALSCSWRGKPSPSLTWSRRCNKVSWLQLLCGVMSPPSTADHGVASWMASLAESRASLTASLENVSVKTTSATSGPMLGASSSSPARGLSSSKMSAAWSRREVSSAYGETFAGLVSRLSRDCLQRQKSARRTSGSGCSSSQWPTANAASGGPDRKRRDSDAPNSTLSTAAAMWGTPTTRDWKDTGNLENVPENGLLGPNQNFGAGGIPLPAQAAQWATPCARDHMPPHSPEYIAAKKADGHGMKILPDQVQQWPTPTSLSYGESHQPSNSRSYNLTMDMAKDIYSRLAHPTYTVGETSSHPRRSLNPLFVEWLMGWPLGWTLLAWTDFGCSATELFHWKQRMRFALSQLDLHDAPPAQNDLFA